MGTKTKTIARDRRRWIEPVSTDRSRDHVIAIASVFATTALALMKGRRFRPSYRAIVGTRAFAGPMGRLSLLLPELRRLQYKRKESIVCLRFQEREAMEEPGSPSGGCDRSEGLT